MNLDLGILHFLNSLIGKYPHLDSAVIFTSELHLVKMAPMVLILWSFWFGQGPDIEATREKIVKAFLGCFLAMFLARLLATSLPFRLRPIHNESLGLVLPHGLDPHTLDSWSSFPSDHAALGFALATSIFLIHRGWGVLALLHTVVLICLPRVYLSFHYPTDVAAGGLVGIVAALLVMKTHLSTPLTQRIHALERVQPAVFYVFFLLMASQMIGMFEDMRRTVTTLAIWYTGAGT